MTSAVSTVADRQLTAAVRTYDAIIIGAGISGIYHALPPALSSGMNVRVFEAGTDVGGTWYWCRYPGRPLRFRKLDLRLFLFR